MKDNTGKELERSSKWYHSFTHLLIPYAITYSLENICCNQGKYLMVYLISGAYFKQDVCMLQMQIYFNLYAYEIGKTEYINVKIYPVYGIQICPLIFFFPLFWGCYVELCGLTMSRKATKNEKKIIFCYFFVYCTFRVSTNKMNKCATQDGMQIQQGDLLMVYKLLLHKTMRSYTPGPHFG